MKKYKKMTLKFPNQCGACGKDLGVGSKAWGMKSSFAGSRWHFECEECHQEQDEKKRGNSD